MNPMMMQNDNYFYVKVQNGGGFVSEIYVDYEYNGQQYSYDSGIVFLGSYAKVMIPYGAIYIHLKVETWLYYRSVIACNKYLPNNKPSCFYLYGTIYYPVCAQVPCNSIDSTLPPSINTCCKCCCNSCCNP